MRYWEAIKALEEGRYVQYKLAESYVWHRLSDMTGLSLEVVRLRKIEFRIAPEEKNV